MILALSADDSSDQATIISAGAVIGFPSDLFEVERKWQQRLSADGIEYFKASECENLRGQFDSTNPRWTPDAARIIADSMHRDLKAIFRYAPIVGLGISLLLTDFREAIAESKLAFDYYGTDQTIALYKRLLNTVVLLLEKDWPESQNFPIACEFDSHSNYRKAEEAYRQLRDRDPLYAKRLGHIGHGDDKKVPSLQMADMVAYESRLRTMSWLRENGDLKVVFEKDSVIRSMYYLGIVTKEDLLRFREI
jgi:hypothetical protein